MTDIAMILLTMALFLVAALFVRALDRFQTGSVSEEASELSDRIRGRGDEE